jgi:flagellar hook protein FlgE
MSLFGAMTSGVSGLVAQSSAMGAIADNITNVNTIGYKNTKTDFQTLVTKQTSATFYSAGGVQARPLQLNDVQGLLQATTSQTDIGVSGAGYFVVNESSRPSINSEFLFTRAGSFYQDNEGYLRNTSGLYLQAWPTDPEGNVMLPPGSNAGQSNANIISTDFLQTVNLSRIGGTASQTSKISIGANLPSRDDAGSTHKVDVQFFDTLGTTNDISFQFIKNDANQWDLKVEPPAKTALLNLYDSTGAVHMSIGQLEFTGKPATGSTFTLVDPLGGPSQTFEVVATATPGPTPPGEIVVSAGMSEVDAVRAIRDAINGQYPGLATTKSGMETVLLLHGSASHPSLDVTGIAITNTSGNAGVIQSDPFRISETTTTGPSIQFNAAGLPAAFNVATMSVSGFANGSADLNNTDLDGDGDVDVFQISLDFGTLGEANGMTQFGADFSPTFIQQNGARFGVFSGVSISSDGLVTALFDNGELRPIYKVPLATFVNPNGLESRSGNAWTATQASGNPTLRVADQGPAGQVTQAALEASTVDIGEEFTDMIMVQRAYSAATKIISTADEMLEELVRIKR